MNPSPQQINQAMQNERRPYRTHGAKARDALMHVQHSRHEKTGWRAGPLESSWQMKVTEVTREV